MTCLKCQHGIAVKAGTTNANTQRFRCHDCGARFTEPRQNPLGSHTMTMDDAVKVFTLIWNDPSSQLDLRTNSKAASKAVEAAIATVDHSDIRGSVPHNRDPSGATSD